jgi:ABC-type multidrug transport system ATPase subunit
MKIVIALSKVIICYNYNICISKVGASMSIVSDMNHWFDGQKKWVQLALLKIVESDGNFSNIDIDAMVNNCKEEAKGNPPKISSSIEWRDYFNPAEELNIVIKSITNIFGVNALKSDATIQFEDSKLSIFYGENGAGKTGYSRILKKISDPNLDLTILPNVFKKKDEKPKCVVDAVINKNPLSLECDLSQKITNPLNGINVFDKSVADIYISEAKEAIYEPKILRILNGLVKICDSVKTKLSQESGSLEIIEIPVPENINSCDSIKQVANVNREVDIDRVKQLYKWDKTLEEHLVKLQNGLQTDSDKEVLMLEKRNAHLVKLNKNLQKLYDVFNPNEAKPILALKNNIQVKLTEVRKTAEVLKDKSRIKNIGSELWANLWEAAKEFSTKEVYPSSVFPKTQSAKCVLCHQEIDQETGVRLEAFNEYILNKANEEYLISKTGFDEKSINASQLININELDALIGACDFLDNDNFIRKFISDVLIINKELFKSKCEKTSISIDMACIDKITNLIKINLDKIEVLNESMDEKKKKDTRKEVVSISAQKWISSNIKLIETRNRQLKQKQVLELSKRLTITTSITRKCTDLAKVLITDAFIDRFSNELKELGANHIKVDIKQQGGTKGQVNLKIVLRGSRNPDAEIILSDGEKRIVALAGFIADILANSPCAPIVFDDPISSVDIDYEDNIIGRLLSLSEERQIIIFTHRLAFYSNIVEKAKNKGISCSCKQIKKIGDDSGFIDNMAIIGYHPKKRLTELNDHYIPSAKKLLKTEDLIEYDEKLKSTCTRLRECLEFIVEKNFFGGIISRFRREVKTKNLIKNVHKIEKADCYLLDDMMTKYSFWEHSQPFEKPVALPSIDEVEQDISQLQDLVERLNAVYK